MEEMLTPLFRLPSSPMEGHTGWGSGQQAQICRLSHCWGTPEQKAPDGVWGAWEEGLGVAKYWLVGESGFQVCVCHVPLSCPQPEIWEWRLLDWDCKYGKERDWPGGPSPSAQLLLETAVHWLCTKSGFGSSASFIFPGKALVRSGKSYVGV